MKIMIFLLLVVALGAGACSNTRFYHAYAPGTPVLVKDSNDSTLLSITVPKGRFGISTKYFTTDTCLLTIGAQTVLLKR